MNTYGLFALILFIPPPELESTDGSVDLVHNLSYNIRDQSVDSQEDEVDYGVESSAHKIEHRKSDQESDVQLLMEEGDPAFEVVE